MHRRKERNNTRACGPIQEKQRKKEKKKEEGKRVKKPVLIKRMCFLKRCITHTKKNVVLCFSTSSKGGKKEKQKHVL